MTDLKSSNCNDAPQLRSEGGSDVFTSTRHSNPNDVSIPINLNARQTRMKY